MNKSNVMSVVWLGKKKFQLKWPRVKMMVVGMAKLPTLQNIDRKTLSLTILKLLFFCLTCLFTQTILFLNDVDKLVVPI